jgi:hypothetical protein
MALGTEPIPVPGLLMAIRQDEMGSKGRESYHWWTALWHTVGERRAETCMARQRGHHAMWSGNHGERGPKRRELGCGDGWYDAVQVVI